MLETLLPLAGMWALGWWKKNKTKIDHKAVGPAVNAIVGTAITSALAADVSMATLKEGLTLAAYAELGLAGAKSATRLPTVIRNGGRKE